MSHYCLARSDGSLLFVGEDRRGRLAVLRGAPGAYAWAFLGPRASQAIRLALTTDAYTDEDGDALRGIDAARLRFARESRHCWRCGSPLTAPTSLRLGIGPECRKRAALHLSTAAALTT